MVGSPPRTLTMAVQWEWYETYEKADIYVSR